MRKLDFFWMSNKDWYYQKSNGVFTIKSDAPPEAQESYKHYLEQSKRASERVEAGLSMD